MILAGVLQIGGSLLAGLLSFLTPCVLPLVPVYLTILGKNVSRDPRSAENHQKWLLFLNGLFFMFGFSLIFIGTGILVSILGGFLVNSIKIWIARVGGVLIIVLGLHLSGLINLRFLDYELKIGTRNASRGPILESFLLGIIFAAGWSACTGPILGAIFTMTLVDGKILAGVLNLVAYSVGLGIPFLVAALSADLFSKFALRFQKTFKIVRIVSGILLIILGVLLSTGLFLRLQLL